MSARLIFLDTETTGLQPHHHELWEIGLIERRTITHADQPTQVVDTEHVFTLKPDLTKADPAALRISRFYERTADLAPPSFGLTSGTTTTINVVIGDASPTPRRTWSNALATAEQVARLLDGAHLIGVNPTFDAAFLQRWLFKHGHAGTWNYHLVDVRALALGWLAGYGDPQDIDISTDGLVHAMGLDPLPGRHTAIGDARLTRMLYDAATADGRCVGRP